ncbi:MAG TPA: LemA family protein [Terriglobales bacterium]|nr:LemA family protein [Terriglobales bacterium]
MEVSPGLVALAVAVAALLWIIAAFNGLVALRNRVRNGWAEIDLQLKRRHDLIPNLVESVRGYMQHERSVFEAVTQARSQAIAAGGDVQQRSAAESVLTTALGQLFARVENYPQLRAVESVQLLQEQLTSTENRIAFARQFYNDEVTKYNTVQSTFPRSLFAGLLGFSPASMFTALDADRANVQVKV